MNKIEIFVASGSDLKKERQHAIPIINKLGKALKHLNLNLEIVEWETDLPSGSYNGKTIQEEIDPLLEKSDIVLVLFYSKLGKFTVHEYRLALQKKKKIFLYFKIKKEFSPENEQYRQVLDFKDKVEKENKVLFKQYNTVGEFKEYLKDDLTLYLLQEYGRKDEVLQRILRGSRTYYERLRGENGRFRMLHIEDLILSRTDTKDKWVPQSVSGDDEGYDKDETVITLLPHSWKQSRKHAVIVGDGGMGKTVSLVRLWESLLDRIANEKDEPVPVFIALNEFNQVKEENRQGFILNYIRENYCDSSTSIEEIWEAMKQSVPEDAFKPRIALMLDGFNEITVEKKELLLEIKRIMEQCPGTRIVLTSRFDMRGQYQWGNWSLVRLMKLEKIQVESYLQEKNLGIPGQARFLELIGNPMMLTLYAATCEVQIKSRESGHCCFKDRVESVGELLWNVMEAQVGNLGERLGEDREKVYYYKFLLKFFLPALGFEMEKAGLFDFTNAQIKGHIDFICKRFSQDDFFNAYGEFDEYVENLPLGEGAHDVERRKRAAKLKRIFCEELHMLVKEGESFRFLHQDFRDFFAAMHLLNEIEMGMADGGRIPEVMKDRCLSYFVRRMMGEIEEEHYAKPYVVEGEGWKSDIDKGNKLHGLVDCCRGKFGEEVGYAVWNVVSTWQEVRGELSGAYLSRLDLSRVVLNGVRCSRLYGGIGGRYLAAVFDMSRVHERNLFPRGDREFVSSAVYNAAGDKIVSPTYDYTVKEWDAAT
ncbi:MAG: NACHT domain-containing protein, partial [Candidatus Aminicenantes bacterium]|nr:NACHT domain-containing protein [Candidatus Aminicenantes bacterium]NIM77859.1 NACHT domain-containing protein [Candidatus Aminicenantes bacterium]NIN17171.1 NACHT domain-containing protein [Candidatus Aminicenantes bacterium]NIN41064.1 NACHT domain-containing protein [Candidatus Aminicenantes bacterium]NIN83869.1 NACHT domain-containing protein [Candidatus Aminicenantes bacterium]